MILEYCHPCLLYIYGIWTSKVSFSYIQCRIYVWANRAIAQGLESWGGGVGPEQEQDPEHATLLH